VVDTNTLLAVAMNEPLASRKFSGKFMVRVPPDVHRELTVEAAPYLHRWPRYPSASFCVPCGYPSPLPYAAPSSATALMDPTCSHHTSFHAPIMGRLTTSFDIYIYSNMKTTIDIPDSLMARCKQTAAEQNVTFRQLVEEGLQHVLDERNHREPFRLREVPFRGGGFKPGFDQTNWDAIREAVYEGHGS